MTTPDGADTHPDTVTARPGSDATADEIVADIEATRAQLGDTVDALSAKFDVRAQARNTLDDAGRRAASGARDARARGADLVARVTEAATDGDGGLTPQARAVAIRVAVGLAAVVVLRAAWRRVR